MATTSTWPVMLALAALCLPFATPAIADEAAPVADMRPGVLAGYLKPSELPDSVALLPPPPALGSAAEALDEEVARQALMLRDTERFKLAALDADFSFPAAAGTFSCVLGVSVTPEDAPTLYRLLRRVMADAGAATGAAKDKYLHARPFMLDGEPTCLPSAEKDLRSNGSFPSGHTSIGWAGPRCRGNRAGSRRGRLRARPRFRRKPPRLQCPLGERRDRRSHDRGCDSRPSAFQPRFPRRRQGR